MESVNLGSSAESGSLPNSLHEVLRELSHRHYPHVPNPQGCKKRASVALILRVRPTYSHWETSSSPPVQDESLSVEERLRAFFSQPWVQHGDTEVLFIKRASRVGDRWTGHVALPGGKRDPEDTDDKHCAVRETAEEIGLDLTTDDCIFIGNLPERVVTTSWGTVPLMVLSPFVFLTTRGDSPTLRLQPTEVASTHWVSLRHLLSPSSRTVEYVDVASRYAKRAGRLSHLAFRTFMGFMQFSAIRLTPTESLLCNSTPEFFSDEEEYEQSQSLTQRLAAWCWGSPAHSTGQNRPLLLWGLTLGILADFLDMLPPHTAVLLWNYPTFTPPDLRLIVSLLTYRLRKRNILQVTSGARPNNTAVDGQTAAWSVTADSHDNNQVGIGGLGVGRYYGSSDKGNDGKSYAVGIMLKGYYERLRVALHIFIAWRVALGSVAAAYAWRYLRR